MRVDMRDAFFNKLVTEAKLDPNIIILSADHGAFALEEFSIEYPNQYINIGISEQNMVGVAAGLALSGKTVFIYGIAPFVSLRVLEQLTIDVAAMNLPVNVISVGAGFTYSTDGQTHLGLQDMAAVMTIPGMTILNSSDPINTSDFVEVCLKRKTPHYVRIEKEKFCNFSRNNLNYLHDGFSLLHTGDSEVLLISTGAISQNVKESLIRLNKSTRLSLTHIDIHKLKPINEKTLAPLISNYKKIGVIEESYPSGLESLIARICLKLGWAGKFVSLNVDDAPIFKGASRDKIKESKKIGNQDIDNFIDSLILN